MSRHGVTLVYGAPGTGKSTLLAGAILRYAERGPVLVLDLTGDLGRAVAPEHKALRLRVTTIRDAAEYRVATRGNFFRAHKWEDGDAVMVTPRAGKLDEAVALWLALVQHPAHRRKFTAALCDEAEQLYPPGAAIPAGMREAALFARNEGRSLVLATKRPTAVSPTLRSSAMRAAVFRVQSDADAKACEELGPAVLFRKRVQSLPRGKFLYYDGELHTPETALPECDSRDTPPWLRSK